MFEANDGTVGGGQELLFNSYDTLEDFISGNRRSGQFSSVDLVFDYSISGFAADNNGFYLAFESDDGQRGFDEEILFNTYATIEDVINGNRLEGAFSPVDLSAEYSISGFASILQTPPTPASTPNMYVIFLLGLIVAIRRKR